MSHKKIFIIAGEPSGDFIGAALMQSCNTQEKNIEWSGVGGSAMEKQNLHSLFPIHDIAVMGIAEVLPKLALILRRIQQTAKEIARQKPDIVITIDAPDFSFRVVKAAQKIMGQQRNKTQFIHYVAPTVWAWRAGRAKKVARLYDRILCLFDFEPPYFQKVGMKADFVGHPMVNMVADTEIKNKAETAGALNLPDEKEWILLLPGSRLSVIKKHWPIMIEAAQKINQNAKGRYHFICPNFSHMQNYLKSYDVQDLPLSIIEAKENKFSLYKNTTFAIAVSGTVGLELAYLNVPHLVTYKLNPLSYYIVRKMVKIAYAHLANLMAGRAVVPELLQDKCNADEIIAATEQILHASTKQDFSYVEQHIKPQGQTPSDMAAHIILNVGKK